MLRIIFFVMVMALLALADSSVLQTGQIKSYDADGNIITDGSIKDDGYYRAGVPHSYGRSGDVVIDNATGLKWKDDITVVAPWITQENYDKGWYYDTSGNTAKTYCQNIPYNGLLEWRLPAIEELQTLVDYSQYAPSAAVGVFSTIPSSEFWSSTTAVGASPAWFVGFNDGYSSYQRKSLDYSVRCVQGEPSYYPYFSRNPVTEIVTDSATGLQWQDNAIVKSTKRSWIDAINYCEDTLVLGGYSNWRLPNANELLSIVKYGRYDPSIGLAFQYTKSADYWSSTTVAGSGGYWAWSVDYDYGGAYNRKKIESYYVRCVRGGKAPINPSIIMYLLN